MLSSRRSSLSWQRVHRYRPLGLRTSQKKASRSHQKCYRPLLLVGVRVTNLWMIVKLPTRTAGRMAVAPTLQAMLGNCIVMKTPLSKSGVGEAALLLPMSLGGASAAMCGSPEARILAAIGHRGVLQQWTCGATGSPTLGNKTGAGKAPGKNTETIEKMPMVAAEATGVVKATMETEESQPGTVIANGVEMSGEEAEETVTTKEVDGTTPGRTTEILTTGSLDTGAYEQCPAKSGNDEAQDYFQYANQKTHAELPGQMVEILPTGSLIKETNAEPGAKEEAQTDASAASGKRTTLPGGKARTGTTARAEAAPTVVLQKSFQCLSSPRRRPRTWEGVPGHTCGRWRHGGR